MKLQQLFSSFPSAPEPLSKDGEGIFEQEITGLYFNAADVVPGSVYFAIRGQSNDGHDHLERAVTQGASVLIVNDSGKIPSRFDGIVYRVTNVRTALDLIAARFFDDPSEKLFCFGVTGTNGKTSITFILEHILNANGKLTGVLGTVNHRVGDTVWESRMTTPDPVTLQARLQSFVRERAFGAALEVSSHALDQQRANGVHFNTVVFTNLTLDHLDYHVDMKEYFGAKQKLFTDLMWLSRKRPLFAIINVDDPSGRVLKVAEPVVVWTYGQGESDFRFKILSMSFEETVFELVTPLETKVFKIPLAGVHNVYNVVASIAAVLSCGITLEQSQKSLESFRGIPGRLQRIGSPSGPTAFVDYAHTPDALLNTLSSIKKIRDEAKLTGKIVCVFGCGGDRDKTKRPLMAEIACRIADHVIVTSDNPRTEDPLRIIEDITAGVPPGYACAYVEVDREKAIAQGLGLCNSGDVVLIAGKGHENYQIIGSEKIHFSDVEIAQKYLMRFRV